MGERKIYIKSATHISLQEPMSEKWMTDPVMPEGAYQRSMDPNFRDWLPPLESRRMGKLMRRALVTALNTIQDSGITQPDAIITGTGLGCIENTELFLDQLSRDGEEMLKPTYFMQSTHNTVSSLIAIKTKCHGYNSTYSHKSISFDSALMDAFVQLRLGDINSALVTGNDEMTPSYFKILQRTGYLGQPGEVPAGEASVAVMLSSDACGSLCEIENVSLGYGKTRLPDESKNVDAVLVGTNGVSDNDSVYADMLAQLGDVPQLRYKHLFGECYTASALGLYAAAHLLRAGQAPAYMRMDSTDAPLLVRRMLLVNHSDGQSYSSILLNRI